MSHDRLFKKLFSAFFMELLWMVAPKLAKDVDPGSIEFMDKEIFTDVTGGERHEVDILVKLRLKGQPACILVHVENQATYQPDFPRRMFGYFARIHEKYRIPVYSIAVFSYERPTKEQAGEYRVSFPHKDVLVFRYDVLQLNRLNWRDYVRSENPLASALMAKMNIAPKDRPRVKLECLRLLATFKLSPAKMELIWGFVESYLKLDRQEQRVFEKEMEAMAPAEKEAVMNLPNTWIEKGIEQGLEKGKQVGRLEGKQVGLVEGKQELVLRQLSRRFGKVPAEVERRVRRLGVDRLDELGDALLEFESIKDARAWLSRHD